ARGCAQREVADLPLAQEEAQGQRGEQGDLRVLSQEFRKSSHSFFLARAIGANPRAHGTIPKRVESQRRGPDQHAEVRFDGLRSEGRIGPDNRTFVSYQGAVGPAGSLERKASGFGAPGLPWP